MAVVNWTPQAIRDINDIASFISNDSFQYASVFVRKIFEKERLIAASIRMGRVVPEFQDENIRELIFERYRIIYKVVDEENVHILSIFHGSRILNQNSIFE